MADQTWTLRVRHPSGQTTLPGVAPTCTLADFQSLLASKTGVPCAEQQLLCGFPPKPLQIDGLAPGTPLSALSPPLRNGESITVNAVPAKAPPAVASEQQQPQQNGTHDALNHDEEADIARAIALSLQESIPPSQPTQPSSRPPVPSQTTTTSSSAVDTARAASRSVTNAPKQQNTGAPLSAPVPDGSGRAVVRRVIDSDNSCLFNAVGYVMEGSRKRAAELRRVIVDTVRSDPFTYNEGFLGMENDKYCKWISQPDKWGGAIELSILCRHYGREIAAYDIQTCRCDVYGQDAGYSERVFLLYDGLHYDAMAVCAFDGAPEQLDVTIVVTGTGDFAAVDKAATDLVRSFHQARQFTDTANFTLRCGVCLVGIKGEKEAVEHAKQTGHQNFSEY